MKMRMNFKKTKIVPFNFSHKLDVLPKISFPYSEPLEVIHQTRLLGVTITSNLSWAPHVNDICARATKELWVLIRFKSLGGTRSQLLKVYQTCVRTTLEFASVVFHSGLTIDQSHQIEHVQKKAFAIILAEQYNSYEHALITLNQERLDAKRLQLCIKFAIKCSKSSKHSQMLPRNQYCRDNMRNPKPFKEYQCATSRYHSSPT